MSKKRDIISEIEFKKRRSKNSTKDGYISRLGDISNFIDSFINSESYSLNEVLRYIPLASIATTETYFRHVYQGLIDKGEPYFSNAVKYFKEQGNIKFDLEFLVPLRGKQVTMGEIFSHLLQLNNLNDINSTLTRILGVDFFKFIRDFRYVDSEVKEFSKQFKLSFGVYIESVNRLFELRHILAHEFALYIDLNRKQILEDFKNLEVFISLCDYAISKTIGEYYPLHQQGMNKTAHDKFLRSQKDLNKLIILIKKQNSKVDFPLIGNTKMFNRSIKEWKLSRDSFATSFADTYKGGSIYPLIYWSEMERLTDQMINQLQDIFTDYLK